MRKSLLVADSSSGRTRFSMLETIREFAEEQLVARGEATEVRTAHARYFAGRETDIMALWDSFRQREAYTWFATELANLRTAFRWAADQGDLDVAAPIATYAASLGVWVAQYEPVSWAEELIEPADVAEHRRLARLYVLAAQCYAVGRVDDAVRHIEASLQLTKKRGFDEVPDEVLSSSGFVYSAAGQPERWADLCRSVIALGPGPHVIARACLVMALYQSGESDEARVASAGLLATADATENPNTACYALLAHGLAYLATDPVDTYGVLCRALTIARESDNRQLELAVAVTLCVLAATEGDRMFGGTDPGPIDAFDYLAVTIRRYHDAGSVSLLDNPLAILATVLDRIGYHEQAATITGFAANAMTRATYPLIISTITHLRDVLGDHVYESLARNGEKMTAAAMASYAYDQIDQARAELNTDSE